MILSLFWRPEVEIQLPLGPHSLQRPSRGALACLSQLLVAPRAPWLLAASLQSLPPPSMAVFPVSLTLIDLRPPGKARQRRGWEGKSLQSHRWGSFLPSLFGRQFPPLPKRRWKQTSRHRAPAGSAPLSLTFQDAVTPCSQGLWEL